MTGLQLSVLCRAARGFGGTKGTAINFEQQAGHIRQVNWLLKQRLARKHGGRIVATRVGKRVMDHQLSLRGITP